MVFEVFYIFFFLVLFIGIKFMVFFKEYVELIKGVVLVVILGLMEILGVVWEFDLLG